MQNLAKFVCKKMSVLLIVVMVGVFPGVGHALDDMQILPGVTNCAAQCDSLTAYDGGVIIDCTGGTKTTMCAQSNLGSCVKVYTCSNCPTPYSVEAEGGILVTTCVKKSTEVLCRDADCDANELPVYRTWNNTTDRSGAYIEVRDKCSYNSSSEKCEWSYKYNYSCMSGYYGEPSCSGSGKNAKCTNCTRCPDAGTSSVGSSETVYKCYIKSGQGISDSTGTYVFTADCNYSN